MIDIYCECLQSGLWDEPINAISNLAFFIAAWSIWRLSHCLSVRLYRVKLLIYLMIAIGIGSSLFHTFATGWASLLDIIPIVMFQLFYLWVYTRRVMKLEYGMSVILVLGLLISSLVSMQLMILNGSLSYLPAFLYLLALGIYHFREDKQGKILLLIGAAIFIVALFFRTIDQDICAIFPLCTHFIWHLLNGLMLYFVMRGLLLNLKVNPSNIQ
ncbi:MAG: ceramidase domain-containing protein [Microcoleaceae cyanobacterium]